jgi:hypothetical protein
MSYVPRRKNGVPAQLRPGTSEVRIERPNVAEDGALFTLIEELLGQRAAG